MSWFKNKMFGMNMSLMNVKLVILLVLPSMLTQAAGTVCKYDRITDVFIHIKNNSANTYYVSGVAPSSQWSYWQGNKMWIAWDLDNVNPVNPGQTALIKTQSCVNGWVENNYAWQRFFIYTNTDYSKNNPLRFSFAKNIQYYRSVSTSLIKTFGIIAKIATARPIEAAKGDDPQSSDYIYEGMLKSETDDPKANQTKTTGWLWNAGSDADSYYGNLTIKPDGSITVDNIIANGDIANETSATLQSAISNPIPDNTIGVVATSSNIYTYNKSSSTSAPDNAGNPIATWYLNKNTMTYKGVGRIKGIAYPKTNNIDVIYFITDAKMLYKVVNQSVQGKMDSVATAMGDQLPGNPVSVSFDGQANGVVLYEDGTFSLFANGVTDGNLYSLSNYSGRPTAIFLTNNISNTNLSEALYFITDTNKLYKCGNLYGTSTYINDVKSKSCGEIAIPFSLPANNRLTGLSFDANGYGVVSAGTPNSYTSPNGEAYIFHFIGNYYHSNDARRWNQMGNGIGGVSLSSDISNNYLYIFPSMGTLNQEPTEGVNATGGRIYYTNAPVDTFSVEPPVALSFR